MKNAYRTATLAGMTMVLMVLGGVANATPADPVAAGFDTAKDKVAEYGGAMILLVLVGLGIALGVKYLSRGFRKA